METVLINGHNQFVFSEEEKEKIRDLFVNHNYSQRALMREFNCTQKPISRVLNELGLDHSRGNLSGYKYYFSNEIYCEDEEKLVLNRINNIPSKVQKWSIDEDYFNDLRNPEVIYTIGFLYADGCNHDNNISLCLEEKDGYILERINRNLKNEKPVTFLDKSNKHDFGYNYENQYALHIYNYKISQVLSILGIVPRKSLILTFPKWLHPSMYNHFLRGVFDGDGSVYCYDRKNTTPQYVLTITSTEEFCKALCDISAKYLNIRGHYYDASCHNGITRVFSICGKNVVQKFMEWLYKDGTIFLQRKYDRYCDYFNINNSLIA